MLQCSIGLLNWHIEKADLIRTSQVERSQFAAVEAAKARVNV
jgi:hypothetical protein